MKEKQQVEEEKHGLLVYFEIYKTTFNFHDLGYHHDRNFVLEERKANNGNQILLGGKG